MKSRFSFLAFKKRSARLLKVSCTWTGWTQKNKEKRLSQPAAVIDLL
jgi:hypothetical protein